jgi:rubrerythrin
MPKLKAEPAGQVRSIREFFALARAIEIDAATRYTDTATILRQQNELLLAKVFDRLAETERSHVAEISAWAEHRYDASTLDHPLLWPIPDTFDMPPEEAASSRLMTPYKALASAVRHEQRSFAFWTYVSARAENPDVKAAAERMALEELEHVSLLRGERRRAFHAERQEASATDRAVALSALATFERHLAALIERDPGRWVGDDSAVFLAASGREAASKLDTLGSQHLEPQNITVVLPSGRTDDVKALAEYLTEAYLQLADTARDGGFLSSLQELAKLAVYRLGLLQSEPTGRIIPED